MSFYPIADVSEFLSTLADDIKEDINSRVPEREASAFNRLCELHSYYF